MSVLPLPLHLRAALAMAIVMGPVASALAGCGGTGPEPPAASGVRGDDSDRSAPSSRLDLDDVARLDDALDCARSEVLLDDLDFFDAMRGIDCFFAEDDALLLRAYERASSVDQVLAEWLPTFSPTSQVIVGSNWFAVGAPARLVTLAERLGVSAEPTMTPRLRPHPLAPAQERVGACSTIVSQLIRRSVADPTGSRGALDDAEAALPGIAPLVDSVAGRLVADSDSTPGPDPDANPEAGSGPSTLDARLSAFGPEIKQACADRLVAAERSPSAPNQPNSARTNRSMEDDDAR